MADVHNKHTRSFNMSRIKGKNTKPEMLVRKFLFAHGFRYRLNVKDLPGNPPIILSEFKTVILAEGHFSLSMPAASHVYRNINVHKTFDSGWSRTFIFMILFYKHTIPPALCDELKNAGFVLCCKFAGMDVHDKHTRSYNMSRIKGKNTKPEMMVRKFLFANGFRYRLNV